MANPLLGALGLYSLYGNSPYATPPPMPRPITAAAPIGRRGPAPAPGATVGTQAANLQQQPIHRAIGPPGRAYGGPVGSPTQAAWIPPPFAVPGLGAGWPRIVAGPNSAGGLAR